MKITKLKKQNILKNNQTIEAQKRNRANNPTIKMINNKRRSVSVSEKNALNETQIKKNISFDNSLELDYLNFSQIDLYKYNQSFEDDIFTPNNYKKRIVEERYQNSESTMNENSTIIKHDEGISTNDKSHIINTPSTMCNYYDQSTNKKLNSNNDKDRTEINNEIKKNLSQYYNKNNEQNENNNPIIDKNDKIAKNEFTFNIKCPNIELNNEKPSTKYLTQNLKSNSIINKNKLSKYINKNKENKETKSSNSQNKVNKISPKNTNQININKKHSKSNEKLQYKLSNKSSLKNTKDEIKLNNKDKIFVNPIQTKNKKQKPLNLCYNQNKYDAYFNTPRNINKKNDVKNLSSNKTKKINISTGPIEKNKSFNNTKSNQSNIIKNNLIYLNNNEVNNQNISNFKMLNDLLNDFEINSKNYNKTTPKSKTKIKKEISSSKKDFIKVNLKNNTKSSSNMAKTQKNFFTKNKNQIFYPFNQNSKLKSEIKQPFNIYKNISKKGNKNTVMFSPMSKNDPSSINYEIQKTLTEQNIIVHKMHEATPKNYKVQKYDSVPFTAMVKKIFVGSSKKDSLIRFDSSIKKKQNQKTKTEQMKCIFKPKTQSDLKNYDKIFGDYGNDKHVKQKLLDRMNKATNNWQYIFIGNKNKKLLNEGVSNMKNKNNDKEHIDYLSQNDDIISDGSEKEDEN